MRLLRGRLRCQEIRRNGKRTSSSALGIHYRPGDCGGWRANVVKDRKERKLFALSSAHLQEENPGLGRAGNCGGVYSIALKGRVNPARRLRDDPETERRGTDRSNGQRIKNPATWNS